MKKEYICLFCGEEFEMKRYWQKFCSKEHRYKYWNEIKRTKQIAAQNTAEPSGVIAI